MNPWTRDLERVSWLAILLSFRHLIGKRRTTRDKMAPCVPRLLLPLLLLAVAGTTADAANVRDHAHKPVMAPTTTATDALLVNDETQVPASIVVNSATLAPDVYHSVGASDSTVQELLTKFMAIYKTELSQTALNASVLQVLHAQVRDPRISSVVRFRLLTLLVCLPWNRKRMFARSSCRVSLTRATVRPSSSCRKPTARATRCICSWSTTLSRP